MESEVEEIKEEIVLAQWQTCVEMANAVSERRDNMNNLFITINLAVIAAISYVWEIQTIALCIAGIILCIIWMAFIYNFKQLNTVKFDVINKMEKDLPIQAFNDEWESLKKNKHYFYGSTLEIALAVVFLIGYTALVIILAITGGNKNDVQSVYQSLVELLRSIQSLG